MLKHVRVNRRSGKATLLFGLTDENVRRLPAEPIGFRPADQIGRLRVDLARGGAEVAEIARLLIVVKPEAAGLEPLPALGHGPGGELLLVIWLPGPMLAALPSGEARGFVPPKHVRLRVEVEGRFYPVRRVSIRHAADLETFAAWLEAQGVAPELTAEALERPGVPMQGPAVEPPRRN